MMLDTVSDAAAPLQGRSEVAGGRALRNGVAAVVRGVTRLRAQWTSRAEPRLRVAETVSFGEKRFLAIVEVDGERLLIGGAAGQVSLLRSLDPMRDRTAMVSAE